MNYQPRKNAARLGFYLLLVGVGFGVVRAAPQAAQAPVARYGPFSISNMKQMQSSLSKGKTMVKMDGPNLAAKSSRYDITSPHITLNLAKIAIEDPKTQKKTMQFRTETATANGGATVVFRSPDNDLDDDPSNDETTTVTCDRARYVAVDAAKDLGRLTMTGNVRSVTRGPAYGNTPLVQTWDTFYVDFVNADTINTGGENGNINGAIREPAPRPKTAAPGNGATKP